MPSFQAIRGSNLTSPLTSIHLERAGYKEVKKTMMMTMEMKMMKHNPNRRTRTVPADRYSEGTVFMKIFQTIILTRKVLRFLVDRLGSLHTQIETRNPTCLIRIFETAPHGYLVPKFRRYPKSSSANTLFSACFTCATEIFDSLEKEMRLIEAFDTNLSSIRVNIEKGFSIWVMAQYWRSPGHILSI